MHWTCTGPLKGNCGITHRTREEAQLCCARGRRLASPGQVHDREPVPSDDDAREYLAATPAERLERWPRNPLLRHATARAGQGRQE